MQLIELEGDIKELELEININNNREIQQIFAILRVKYNELSSNKVIASLIRLKRTYYDQGEKARRIKTLQNERSIHETDTTNGGKISNPIKIEEQFESFFSQLYSSAGPVINETFHNLFEQLNIPSLSDEARAELD